MRSSKSWGLGLFAIVLLSAWSAGCPQSPPATINAIESDNGRTINLRAGDEVKVSLAENPTTGYKWEFLAKPEPECVMLNDAYVANPAANSIGGGGAHNWDFRAVKTGTASLSLGYRRPWEKSAPPAKTFTLTLVVK